MSAWRELVEAPRQPSEPSRWAQSRKALVALGVALVGESAAILAATDDGHVTMQEGVAIALGTLALLLGPATVYGVRNARTAAQVTDDLEHLTGAHPILPPELPTATAGETHSDDRTPLQRHLEEPWAPPE